MKILTQNDEEASKLPSVKKSKSHKRRAGSEGDSDLDMPVEEFEKRQKKKQKKKKTPQVSRTEDVEDLPKGNCEDIVKDMNMDDWD